MRKKVSSRPKLSSIVNKKIKKFVDKRRQHDQKKLERREDSINATLSSIASVSTIHCDDLIEIADDEFKENAYPASRIAEEVTVTTSDEIVSIPKSLECAMEFDSYTSMNLGQSFQVWTQDVNELIVSHEFQRLLQSSGNIALRTTDIAVKTMLLPVTVPIKIASSLVSNTIGLANNAFNHIVQHQIHKHQHEYISMVNNSESEKLTADSDDSSISSSGLSQQKLLNAAFGFIPFALDTASKLKDDFGLSLINLVSGQNAGQSSLEQPSSIIEGNKNPLNESPRNSNGMETSIEKELSIHHVINEEPILDSCTVRVCDLNLYSVNDPKSKLVTLQLKRCDDWYNEHMSSAIDSMVEIAKTIAEDPIGPLKPIMSPLSDNILSARTKSPLANPLSSVSPVQIKRSSKTISINHALYQQIRWKGEGSTGKLLKNIMVGGRDGIDRNEYTRKISATSEVVHVLESELLVWSGSVRSKGYGSKIPMIKARGIIGGISPSELVEIFLDSSKVQMYNKHSNGRRDLHILHSGSLSDKYLSTTKIVENEMKVPFSSKNISVSTLLHARQLYEESVGEYIIVSRSADTFTARNKNEYNRSGKMKDRIDKQLAENDYTSASVAAPGSKNEIMWGVNILRKVPGHPNKVDLTTFTQANSSSVPGFLAQKVGMMCTDDFFKSLRNMQ